MPTQFNRLSAAFVLCLPARALPQPTSLALNCAAQLGCFFGCLENRGWDTSPCKPHHREGEPTSSFSPLPYLSAYTRLPQSAWPPLAVQQFKPNPPLLQHNNSYPVRSVAAIMVHEMQYDQCASLTGLPDTRDRDPRKAQTFGYTATDPTVPHCRQTHRSMSQGYVDDAPTSKGYRRTASPTVPCQGGLIGNGKCFLLLRSAE